jgi:hypothetical protein
MTEPALPEPFEDLAPFVDWALETERARTEKKVGASMDEIRVFHGAVLPRLDAMIEHLEGFSDGDMPVPEHRLYLMALSLVEVASLVEHYGQREVIEACDPLRFEPWL